MKLGLRSPCPVRPDLAASGDCKSACALCKKTVHHLSRMTEAEGRSVLERSDSENMCVRYVADRDGSVVFAPALRRAAAAGLLAFAPVAFADGGDLHIQVQAEQNRIQDEMGHLGIPGEQVAVDSTEVRANAEQAAQASQTAPEPEPDLLVLWDGGI